MDLKIEPAFLSKGAWADRRRIFHARYAKRIFLELLDFLAFYVLNAILYWGEGVLRPYMLKIREVIKEYAVQIFLILILEGEKKCPES
mgnify:CR=1 FL=1